MSTPSTPALVCKDRKARRDPRCEAAIRRYEAARDALRTAATGTPGHAEADGEYRRALGSLEGNLHRVGAYRLAGVRWSVDRDGEVIALRLAPGCRLPEGHDR